MTRIVTVVLLALGLVLVGAPAQAKVPPQPPGHTSCVTFTIHGVARTSCRVRLDPPGLVQCTTVVVLGRTVTKCRTVWPNATPRTRILR